MSKKELLRTVQSSTTSPAEIQESDAEFWEAEDRKLEIRRKLLTDVSEVEDKEGTFVPPSLAEGGREDR